MRITLGAKYFWSGCTEWPQQLALHIFLFIFRSYATYSAVLFPNSILKYSYSLRAVLHEDVLIPLIFEPMIKVHNILMRQ